MVWESLVDRKKKEKEKRKEFKETLANIEKDIEHKKVTLKLMNYFNLSRYSYNQICIIKDIIKKEKSGRGIGKLKDQLELHIEDFMYYYRVSYTLARKYNREKILDNIELKKKEFNKLIKR